MNARICQLAGTAAVGLIVAASLAVIVGWPVARALGLV